MKKAADSHELSESETSGAGAVPRASHDSVNPPNLVQFMLKDWKSPSGKLPPPLKQLPYFKTRREHLSKQFIGQLLLIPTGHYKVRANDTHYPFRASSDFFYLTGCLEPDCVLAFVPEGKGHRQVLFVEPNPGKTDATFFTDRVKGELWEGPRLGVKESRAKYGIDDTRSLAELEAFVAKSAAASSFAILRGHSLPLEKLVSSAGSVAGASASAAGTLSSEQTSRDAKLATALSEMRLLKDKQEINELQAVVNATKRGFEDVIRRLKTAKSERELEGVFFTRARMEGNDVGYGSIVASGAHACTLHWKKNDGAIRKGDLLLLDAGIEGNSLYTADITRTFPTSGKFTREQKIVYELVLRAQDAAMNAVKPGHDFMEPNRAAMKVLAEGLEELGFLKSAADALKDQNQFYKRYSLHNVSHMLGLDVHDCASARAETYKFGTLQEGMVLTVEPGLYFQVDDLTVPPKFRGIGVRIEDDVVVTAKGCKNLSAGIPKTVKDIESWMKALWSEK